MPAKKKPAAKKSSKAASKPTRKKVQPKKKETLKKPDKKKIVSAIKEEKKPQIIATPIPESPKPAPEPEIYTGPMKDCDHCDATGMCAAGQPYDKGHHQMFGSKIRLTSCIECLEAIGEHHNSKKLVACSFCKGTGKVPE